MILNSATLKHSYAKYEEELAALTASTRSSGDGQAAEA